MTHHSITYRLKLAAYVAIVLCAAISHARAGDPEKLSREIAEQRVLEYMSAVASDLPPRVQATLDRIPNMSRKLLAIKYYLQRSEEEIELKWAWSGKRADWYRKSAEYRQALIELEKARQMFAQMNPGYALEVRVEIRSLASQVGKWN